MSCPFADIVSGMNFSTGIDIDAATDRVWSVMTDVERWHEWTASITSVRRLDSGPFGSGARVRVKQPRLAPQNWIVTDWQQGRSFTWVTSGPGLRVTATHAVQPTSSGSRVNLSLRFEGVLGVVLARLFRSLTTRYMQMEAEGLKHRSERHTAR